MHCIAEACGRRVVGRVQVRVGSTLPSQARPGGGPVRPSARTRTHPHTPTSRLQEEPSSLTLCIRALPALDVSRSGNPPVNLHPSTLHTHSTLPQPAGSGEPPHSLALLSRQSHTHARPHLTHPTPAPRRTPHAHSKTLRKPLENPSKTLLSRHKPLGSSCPPSLRRTARPHAHGPAASRRAHTTSRTPAALSGELDHAHSSLRNRKASGAPLSLSPSRSPRGLGRCLLPTSESESEFQRCVVHTHGTHTVYCNVGDRARPHHAPLTRLETSTRIRPRPWYTRGGRRLCYCADNFLSSLFSYRSGSG